jgi:hypothetical protein
MGVRLVTDSARVRGLERQKVSSNYRMEILYDGGAGKDGLSLFLPANEIWVDGSSLWRTGLNIGPTFQNIGAQACDISGSGMPREYAQKIYERDLITEMSLRWEPIAAGLAAGLSVTSVGKIYSLLRFVFAAGAAGGAIAVLTL